MINDDEPIQTRTRDVLGREPIARRMAEIILNRPTNAPLVLALHGPWGSGKSSVLALLREALKRDEVVSVEFQPWLFNNVEQLVGMFFSTVQRALVDAGASERKVRKTVQKLGGLLTAATKYAGFEVDFEKLLEQSPEELRDDLCRLSNELGKRIVVIVDDVDRLPVSELGLLVKLVRLCGNFPFFTYVLAYDRRVVSASLRTLYQGDSDFLDKIVQVEVPLPPVPPRLIADFIGGGIRALGESLEIDTQKALEIFEVRDDEMRQELAPHGNNDEPIRLIRSLRDAKRLLNALSCTLPLLRAEVDLADFVRLEMIRVFFPVVYDRIYDERFSFATFDSQTGDDERRKKRQEQHRKFATEIQTQQLGAVAVKILCDVFPIFYAALYSQNQHYGRQQSWQRLMRASDPGQVEKYFQLRVPLDSVPRKEVRALIDAVNAAPSADARKALFSKNVVAHYENGSLKPFLTAIDFEANRATVDALTSMIQALADSGSLLAQRPMEQRETSTAVMGTLWLAKHLGAAADAVMAQVVAASNRSYVVLLLAYAEPNPYQPSGVGVAFEPMRQAFVARLTSEVANGDIFALYPDEWTQVLLLWRDPAAATAYLIPLLQSQPRHWETLTALCLDRRDGFSSISVAVMRRVLALGDLAAAAANLDLTQFDGDARASVGLLVDELQLVPRLIREVMQIRDVAQQLRQMPAGTQPTTIDWATPVWTLARPRLEPAIGNETLWPGLVGLYSEFSTLQVAVEQVDDLSSPEAATQAVARTQALHASGEALEAQAQAVADQLRGFVGAQTLKQIKTA